MRRPLLNILTVLFYWMIAGGHSLSAQTLLRGQIIEKGSGQPLQGATVSWLDRGLATSTDKDGRFYLIYSEQTEEPDSLFRIQVHAMGFQRLDTLWKDNGKDVTLYLERNMVTIDEVVIHHTLAYSNRNNPAVDLVRHIIDNRYKNRSSSTPFLRYRSYEKIMMAVSGLPNAIQRNPLFKNYQFIFENVDTLMSPGRRLLPLYLEEKITEEYRRHAPAAKKSIIDQYMRTELDKRYVNNNNIQAVVSFLHNEIDLYDNTILLFNRPFMSPIAHGAPAYYKYVIQDTIQTNEGQFFRVAFVPRNEGERLFSGMLLVSAEGEFAVKEAEIHIGKQANINFINDLRIHFEYQKQASGIYLPRMITSKVNFGIYGSKEGMFSHWVRKFDEYQFDPIPSSVFNGEQIALRDSSRSPLPNYLHLRRPQQLTLVEENLYKNMDELQKNKGFMKTLDWIYFITKGYKFVGGVDLGPLENVLSYNNQEGGRIRIGGRTNASISDKIYGEFYTAYGFRDQRFKYYGLAAVSLTDRKIGDFPVNYLSVSYQHDVREPGQRLAFLNGDDILRSLKKSVQDMWIYHSLFKAMHVYEFGRNVRFQTTFSAHKMEAAGLLKFERASDGFLEKAIRATSLGFDLRWAPNEEYLQNNLNRTTITTPNPIFDVRYHIGLKDFLGGQYPYHAFRLDFQQRFYYRILGFTDVSFGAGYIGGSVPFLLLDIPKADQSYLLAPDAFSLMRDLEFVSDQYLKFDVQHRFQGFFVNKIPLLKKAKIREIVGMKMYLGRLRSENNPHEQAELFRFPVNADGEQTTFAFKKEPYMEANIGIENLFRFLRVEYVRRLSYLNHPGVRKEGVRFSIKVGF